MTMNSRYKSPFDDPNSVTEDIDEIGVNVPINRLCSYHQNDLDDRGVSFPSRDHEPQLDCHACRLWSLRQGHGRQAFPTSEIRKFEKANPDAMQTLSDMRPSHRGASIAAGKAIKEPKRG